jgi:hypothetical protein
VKILKRETIFEKRLKERKPYSGHIFFVSKKGFYEGRLKNYSSKGLFIETNAPLSVGEIITIAIPYIEDRNIKCKGQIMRISSGGVGIELFKKRTAAELRIIK